MTHVVDEVSPIGVATQRRSSSLHNCADGSPLVPDCRGSGCVDCRCGNGGVHGDEVDEWDGWGVLGWCSMGSATPEDDFIEQKFKQGADGVTCTS